MQQWMRNGPLTTPVMPIYPEFDQKSAIEDGYATNVDVYSIVNRKAKMAAGIPFYVYRVKSKEGKKFLRDYKAIMSTATKLTPEAVVKAQFLKIKALTEVEEDNNLSRLIQRPNETDSQQEFLEKCYGFLDITGNTYILKERPEMGANKGIPRRLNTLPSPYMEILPDGMVPVLGVTGYNFFLYGPIGIEKENIIHIKYFNPDYQPNGSHLYGMPPLRAGNKTLTQSNSEVDSMTAQFQHGGPAGMFYNESITPDEQSMALVGGTKNKWERETYGNKNRGKILFSAGKMGYLQAGLSPADLKILEAGTFTFRKLCNLYNMPSPLFNDNEYSTQSNMEQFYKAAYVDGIIPMVMKLRDAFNSFLLPDFGDDGEYFIDADYSNIPVLQVDMKTLTEWMKESWWLTPNEKREAQKFGRLEDPNMDKVWMPSGYATMEEMSMPPVEPIDQDVEELTKAGFMPYK